jgi:hypothetical protein
LHSPVYSGDSLLSPPNCLRALIFQHNTLFT